jgi:hypothetical protein
MKGTFGTATDKRCVSWITIQIRCNGTAHERTFRGERKVKKGEEGDRHFM